jgi:acetyl-CoA carboxylase biotin carboxyl carrier protein
MAGKNSKGHLPEPGRVWSLNDIQELLDLLAGKEITEFEMEQQGVKIRVRRGGPHSGGAVDAHAYVHAPAVVPVVATPPPVAAIPVTPAPATPVQAAPEVPAESTEGLFVMKSPIVGTFYASPAPNAPPFVSVGDTVRVGQVLCIIEAMKLMNELEAETAGQIVRIYVENGQPVEYGQSLFAIEPARKK